MKLLFAVFVSALLLFGALSVVVGVEAIQAALGNQELQLIKIVVGAGMALVGLGFDWAVVRVLLKPQKPTAQEMPPHG